MRRLLTTMVMVLAAIAASAQNKVYISTSFHEPATDGLRFIYSRDGWTWQQIDGLWLRPEVGKQKVMRDPSIVKGRKIWYTGASSVSSR